MINESYNSEHAKTEAMNSQHTRCLKEKEKNCTMMQSYLVCLGSPGSYYLSHLKSAMDLSPR